MLEKANVFQVLKPNDSKKRPAPVPEENVKRSKSETDDGPKIFDDVNWDWKEMILLLFFRKSNMYYYIKLYGLKTKILSGITCYIDWDFLYTYSHTFCFITSTFYIILKLNFIGSILSHFLKTLFSIILMISK